MSVVNYHANVFFIIISLRLLKKVMFPTKEMHWSVTPGKGKGLSKIEKSNLIQERYGDIMDNM